MLHIELPHIDNIERAAQPTRVPIVFTQAEAKAILAHLHGTYHLMASSDPSIPRTDWVSVANGTFSGGVFTFSDLQMTNNDQRFYEIKTP